MGERAQIRWGINRLEGPKSRTPPTAGNLQSVTPFPRLFHVPLVLLIINKLAKLFQIDWSSTVIFLSVACYGCEFLFVAYSYDKSVSFECIYGFECIYVRSFLHLR